MTTPSVPTAHVPQHFHSMHAYPNVTLTVTHVRHLCSLPRLYHSTISNSLASSHHQSSSYHHPTPGPWQWWSSSSSSPKTHLSCCCNSDNHFVKAEGVAHQIIIIIIIVVVTIVCVTGIILAYDGVVMAMTEQLLDQVLHKRLKSKHQVNLLNACERDLKKICTERADDR